jgi:hypothetical protein
MLRVRGFVGISEAMRTRSPRPAKTLPAQVVSAPRE